MNRSIFYITISLIIAFFASQNLWGIPAFARKYKMSCKTCHEPFPRLKPYGAEFAANGFVLKDQESARNFTETGDDQIIQKPNSWISPRPSMLNCFPAAN
jgi:hypothetical protein